MSIPKPAVHELFGVDSDDESVPGRGSRRCASDGPITASQIDSKVVEVADKLADFVSKNGRHYEDLTRERNPGNTPFKFLWNKASKEYRYYECKLNSLPQAQGADAGGTGVSGSRPQQGSHNSRNDADSRRQIDDHHRDRYPADSNGNRHGQHGGRDSYGHDRGRSYRDRNERSSRYNHEDRFGRGRYQEDSLNRNGGGRYHAESRGKPLDHFSEAPSNSRYVQDGDHGKEQDAGRSRPQQLQHGRSLISDEPASKRGRREDGSSASAGAVVGSNDTAAAPPPPAAAGGTATLSAMEQYMQRLEEQARKKREDDEEEERRKQPLLKETAFDRRKVVAVFKDDGQRGHHLDDFIPKEELAKFMAQCGDNQLQQQVEQETAIGADNIGHKLLQKMGWKEGQGIGAKGDGRTAPVTAVKQDNLGLGAQAHGAVEDSDDPFEQYRKRMMLGYKFRPNPLGNPRRSYY